MYPTRNTTTRWYHKGFALIAMLSSLFMFVAFSGSYSTSMKWIDMQLGRIEMRSSQGVEWLKVAIGSGVDVEALDFVVDVRAEGWRAAQDALVGVVSSLLGNILGTVSQVFKNLVSKIQEMSTMFASLGDQSGKILLTIQSVLTVEVEKRVSSCGIVDGVLPVGISTDIRSQVCDAFARLRFASVAQETGDLTAPAEVLPTSENVLQAEEDIARVTTQACDSAEFDEIPFARLVGLYNPVCAAEMLTKLDQVVAEDAAQVDKAFDTLQQKAPFDCKQPFVDFSTSTFTPPPFTPTDAPVAGIYSGKTGQQVSSQFLQQIGAFSGSTEIKVLTPDECESLKGSKDATLAAAQVTPPSGGGAIGLEGVIQQFIDSLTQMVNDLINSIIEIALGALNAVFNSFPRIFSDDGLNGLVGNFANVIRTNLANVSQTLIGYNDTITGDLAIAKQLDIISPPPSKFM